MIYKFLVTCSVNVQAKDEDTAIDCVEELLPVRPDSIELYEVEDEEPDWDAIMDEMRLR